MPRRASSSPVKVDTEALATVRGSMVRIRIKNRTYDAVRDPTCPVCTHPARVQIEERILFNETYPRIAEWISDVDHERIDGIRVPWPKLEPKQLASHFRRRHCPIDAQMLHDLTIERDQAMSEGYETLTRRVVDEMVFADLTLARTQERLVRGDIEPTMKEGLAAAKLKAQVAARTQQVAQADRTSILEEAFAVYFIEAQRIMDSDQWQRFSQALNVNPTLRQLTQRMQDPTPTGEIIDAEIVRDE